MAAGKGPKSGPDRPAETGQYTHVLCSEVPFPRWRLCRQPSAKSKGRQGGAMEVFAGVDALRQQGANPALTCPVGPVQASDAISAKAYLPIRPEVKKALAAGAPVVALESTIITHGMPYPQNLTMAQNVEAVIRQHGAVPATIAVMDGR